MKRRCAGGREGEKWRAGRARGKVDGGADRTTRELEGPKETTRVEPRRWPREKELAKWKRDERRPAAEWDERRLRGGRGRGERGFAQHWGLLIKVGLVDPLMKVQARGLLSALLP